MRALVWITVLSTCFAVGNSRALAGDADAAQHLYDEARYDEALKELGADCVTATAIVRCEELRGWVHMALGQEEEARAAFLRMLIADGSIVMGDNVSPKIKRAVDAAREALAKLRGLRALASRDPEGVLLEVKAVDVVAVNAIRVLVQNAAVETPRAVEMRKHDSVWVGRIEGFESIESLSYVMEITLPAGGYLVNGSAEAPLMTEIGGQALSAQTGELLGLGSDDQQPAMGATSSGMPTWGWWAIGGGVLAVGTAVVVALLAQPKSGDGSIAVTFVFGDEI